MAYAYSLCNLLFLIGIVGVFLPGFRSAALVSHSAKFGILLAQGHSHFDLFILAVNIYMQVNIITYAQIKCEMVPLPGAVLT